MSTSAGRASVLARVAGVIDIKVIFVSRFMMLTSAGRASVLELRAS